MHTHSSAQALRSHIEAQLAGRIPAALSPSGDLGRELLPTGVAEFDRHYGGIPRGGLTEVTGAASSGRTSFCLSLLAQVTQQQGLCAVVDAGDTWHPGSAAAAGVELARVLWVRCGRPQSAERLEFELREESGAALPPFHAADRIRAASLLPQRRGNGIATGPVQSFVDKTLRGSSKHPSSRRVREAQRAAWDAQRPLSQERKEQPPSDRMPARRGETVLKHPAYKEAYKEMNAAMPRSESSVRALAPKNAPRPWERLEQAFQCADLLLQNSGFAALLIDLGEVPAERVTRVPLTTWFRFRKSAQENNLALVVLAQHRCTQSSADMVLSATASGAQWQRAQAGSANEGTLLRGMDFHLEMVRARANRLAPQNARPPQGVRFHAGSALLA